MSPKTWIFTGEGATGMHRTKPNLCLLGFTSANRRNWCSLSFQHWKGTPELNTLGGSVCHRQGLRGLHPGSLCPPCYFGPVKEYTAEEDHSPHSGWGLRRRKGLKVPLSPSRVNPNSLTLSLHPMKVLSCFSNITLGTKHLTCRSSGDILDLKYIRS